MTVKYVTTENLAYFAKRLSEKLNDMFTKGLHSCAACGAPYRGKAICEYCGRSFFVDELLYKGREQDG